LKRRSTAKSIARVLPIPFGMPLSSAGLVILSLGLMIFSTVKPQAFYGMRSGVTDIFAPVLGAVSYPFQRGADFIRDVSGLAQLQADNARLELENERLREWYHTALLLESENKSLRDLLNVKVDPEYIHISARVIADAGNTFVKSLLVAAGNQDGVNKGQAVISGEGLIGRIVEAGERSARILLVTDMNSRVPVVIEDTQINAIMAGTNTGQPQLMHVPQDSELTVGARVITSGYGGVYPPGLPVGRVVSGGGSEKRVELFSGINNIQMVRIIKMPDDPNLRSAQEQDSENGL
jgi:rod shape-determining protein MreC